MPTQASGAHGAEGGDGGGSADEWMPLRMRRARTASLGSASASGADSSLHNHSASASASDIDASQHSAHAPPPAPPGGITRTRSRGSSITQAIPLEAALKEEAEKAKERKKKQQQHQQHGQGEGDDGDEGTAGRPSAASLVDRASSNVSSLLAGSPIKARRNNSQSSAARGEELRPDDLEGHGGDEEEEGEERFVGGGLDGNVMHFIKRSPSKDVEQGLALGRVGSGGGSNGGVRKLPSSKGVSFAGHDDEDDGFHPQPGKGMKRTNTFTIGSALVRGASEDSRRGCSKNGGFGMPQLRGTTSMPAPDLSRGVSDQSTGSELSLESRQRRLRTRANSSTFSIQEELHFDLDPDFDCSEIHLVKLFAMLDKDGNGILTYDELYESLLSMPGLQSIPREKLDELFEKMDEDGTEGVSQEEFVAMFQHIATKALARKGPGNLMEFSVYDYGPDQALCRRIYTKDPDCDDLDKTQVEYSLDEYFEEPIEDVKPGYVRWIAITGLEPSVVVRLANRYRLHPLQVEDVLTYHKQRMKVDKSSHALQLLVGRCVHSEYNGLPQIRKEQVTIFLLEDYNTVITIQQSPSDINRRLLARIMYAGSKIRLNGPRFLAYAVVDAIVDEIFPILRQMRKRLKALHSDVTSTNKRTSLGSIHLIQHIIREANLLLLWLSPLSTVVSRLSSELLGYEGMLPPTPEGLAAGMSDYDLKKHVDDLVDHVAALKEQTSSMIDWAKSLNDEYLNEQQYRMNEVIYILTMTTTMLLPAQFLTGVFGMNFTHFPLLDEVYGFALFWVFTALAVAGILWFFWLKGWWTIG